MAFRVHHVHAPTTVEALAAEIYDVTLHGVGDPTRLAGAMAALRECNPSLPQDGSFVKPAATPFVRVRRIPRTPWRLPPTDDALRADLEGLGVRNTAALVRLSPRYLAGQLPQHRPAVLRRYRDLARLMRIRGIGATTAAFLHDHPTTPLRTPPDVARAGQQTLRDLLKASGHPADLLAERPWRAIAAHARMLSRTRRRRRSQLRPVLVGRRELAREAAFWAARADDPGRDASAARSAARIRWLRELQGEVVRGNAALAARDAATALPHLRAVWSLVGARAAAEGVVADGAADSSGPSVATVVALSRRILADLQPADARLAVERLELEVPEDGLTAFVVRQLRPDARRRCDEALREVPLDRLGARAVVLASRALRARGRPEDPATPAGVLAEVDPAAWREVLGEVALDATTALSLDGPAADLLTPEVLVGLDPALDPGTLDVRTRLVRHAPTAAPDLRPFVLALDDTYEERYRRDVLGRLLEHTGGAGWDFAPVDVADPVRAAFVLPQLFARHLPLALARCLDLLGRRDVARALRAGGVLRPEDLAAPPSGSAATASAALTASGGYTRPLDDAVATGTLYQSAGIENCSDLDAVYEQLRADNERGDACYQAGEYEDAAAAYVQVLEAASGCENLADVVASLPAAHDALIVEAHEWLAGRSTTTIGLVDATATVDDRVRDLLTGTWRESPEPTRHTLDHALGLDDITYFDLVQPGRGGGGITFTIPDDTTSDDGGFDDVDRDDDIEDMILTDLRPEVVHIPPGTGGDGGGGIPHPAGDPVTYVYDVDDLEREVLHAFSYLSQVLAGLNWLGFDPETIPVWSFEHLLSQARHFADQADGLQQRALGLLGSAEVRDREEFMAAGSAAVAAQGVAVAKSQESLARANLEAAETARDAAEEAERHTNDDVFWAIGMGLAAVAAVVLAAPTGGASVAVAAAALGAAAAARGSGDGAGRQTAGVVDAGASTAVQVDGAIEGQQQAASQLEVAEAQLGAAAEQVALAVEQTALAELESAIAAGYLDLLASQTLTANAYYELLDVISALAGRYVLMANRLAWLAERAYQRESRRYSRYVQVSYDRPDDLASRFTSAATLRSHLDALAHEQLTAVTERNQLLATTYSLLMASPTALVALQRTGATQFRITQQELDERFPGLYLHSLDRVEVEFDGLLPAGGVRAVLRTANLTSVRVPHEAGLYYTDGSELTPDWCYPADEFPIADLETPPRFAVKVLAGNGFTQVLSEHRRSRDGVILRVPAGALDTFAHLGTDALWTLEIPRSGNAFDLANITDVRFVLYFSALYSAELAAQQETVLRDVTVGRNTLVAASISAADDLARLVTAPLDDRLRDLRLLRVDVADADLPANIAEREFRNVSLFVHGADGRALAVRLLTTGAPLGAAVTTSAGMADVPDGMAYSAVGDTAAEHPDAPASYRHREGDFPTLDGMARDLRAAGADVTGRWVVKVLPEDNPDWLRRDDDGAVVTVQSGSVVLSDRGTLGLGGVFLHAAVRVHVALGEGTLAVGLRADVGVTIEVAGAVATVALRLGDAEARVTAEIAGVDALCELELAVHDRDAHVSLDGVPLAALRGDEAVAAVPGPVELAFLGAKSAEVADVTVTRLRHDGTPLEELLRETFATADAVELSRTGAVWASREHHQLDLGAVEDVLLQLDYDGRIDFLDGAEPTPKPPPEPKPLPARA